MRKRKPSVLEVSVDDAVVVEEVDGIETEVKALCSVGLPFTRTHSM